MRRPTGYFEAGLEWFASSHDGPEHIQPALAGRDAAGLDAAGRALGAAFGHHLVWLGRKAAALGAERLFFLSREGAWLARHYGRLRRIVPGGDAWPEPVALAVSRRSTFLPSLPEISDTALAPLLAQYRNTTVGTVLESLGLPGEEAREDLPLEERWSAPGMAARVLGDVTVAAALARRHAAQREALLSYLRGQGVPRTGLVAVADIGWKGSIQDNLARLLPDACLTGLYLALHPAMSPPPPNAAKCGFILDAGAPRGLMRRLRFIAPLEFVASDDTPSTLGYTMQDGRPVPVPDPIAVVPHKTSSFQVLQAAIAAGIDACAELHAPSAVVARQQVLKVIEAPHQALVGLFFEAWRDDRFGEGALRRGADRLSARAVLRGMMLPGARRALGLRLAQSGWPWGLLARDLPLAAPLLRWLILRLDARL